MVARARSGDARSGGPTGSPAQPRESARNPNGVEAGRGLVLVTGGAGFIGSNVVAALDDRHVPVAVCDRLRSGDKWRNLARRRLDDLVAPGDLGAWLEEHGRRLEAIVHMGAISSTTEKDADLIVDTNFRLSRDLWRFCARTGTRFIYASSAATYGDGSAGFDDDASPQALARLHPLNAYGWSKHLFDRWVQAALERGGDAPPQWAGLKFFNVYGPNEYHKGSMQSVVARKFPAAAAGEPVTLFRSHRPEYPDGGQRRDFVSVDDCVDVIDWLLESPEVNGLFNVGSGQDRTFADLVGALFAALDRPVRIEYIDMPESIRDRYQYFTRAETDRLREAGYARGFRSLEEGVGTYVRDFLSQHDRYR